MNNEEFQKLVIEKLTVLDSLEKGQKELFEGQKELFAGQTDLFAGQKQLFAEIYELKSTVSSINKTVIKIENEHGEKLSALFDGWKQNTEQLARIENEVSRHEEVILRKIK